eukprot:scaffold291831_cov14-Tisochrysis_lutea.AAC.1
MLRLLQQDKLWKHVPENIERNLNTTLGNEMFNSPALSCCSTAAKPHAHVFDVQKFLDAVSARAQPGQAKLKKCCRAGGKLQLSLEHTQIKSMPEQGQQQAACVLTLIARAPDRFASRLQMARPRWLWLPHLFRPYLCDMKRQIDNGLTGMEGLRTQNCTHAEAAK